MDFGDLKNKVLSALGQAGDVTKDIAGKAADKAKAGGRIAKLNIEIAQEKDSMKKAFVEIGKLYYDTHRDTADGFFIQLCEEVAIAEKAIADKEAEIAALKDTLSSKDEPDIDVEFEEVVAEDEAAASGEAEGEDAADDSATAEEVVEVVEEVLDDKNDAE